MLKIKLSDLLGKHKMTQKDLSERTGIRPGTISKMYHENITQLNKNHIERICHAFGCNVSDLLEYIPDK